METVTRVRIFNREYDIRSSDPDYVKRLGNLLNERMIEVAGETATVDSLKVAILAALNIAGDLLTTRQELEDLREKVQDRSRRLLALLQSDKEASPNTGF